MIFLLCEIIVECIELGLKAATHLSSASQIVKLFFKPILCPSFRRKRAQSEWKVPILMSPAVWPPSRFFNRSRISLAALFVNVQAHIDSGGMP